MRLCNAQCRRSQPSEEHVLASTHLRLRLLWLAKSASSAAPRLFCGVTSRCSENCSVRVWSGRHGARSISGSQIYLSISRGESARSRTWCYEPSLSRHDASEHVQGPSGVCSGSTPIHFIQTRAREIMAVVTNSMSEEHRLGSARVNDDMRPLDAAWLAWDIPGRSISPLP